MRQLTLPINDSDHILGDPFAPIELIEYGDYECPHCGRAYPIVKNIKQQFGDSIRFVFRNFPLSKIHPHALLAAVATEAAGLQDKFWEMHDIIFEHQKSLDIENILSFAGRIGLDLDRFKTDIGQQSSYNKVDRDFESGIRSGVNGTPSFFVNGRKFEGDWTNGGLLEYLENISLIQK